MDIDCWYFRLLVSCFTKAKRRRSVECNTFRALFSLLKDIASLLIPTYYSRPHYLARYEGVVYARPYACNFLFKFELCWSFQILDFCLWSTCRYHFIFYILLLRIDYYFSFISYFKLMEIAVQVPNLWNLYENWSWTFNFFH